MTSANPQARYNEACSFLRVVWAANADGTVNHVRMIAEKGPDGFFHHHVFTVDEAATKSLAISDDGHDAYFACGAYSGFKPRSKGNRTKRNAVGSNCFH